MPGEAARSAARQPLGLPKVTAAARMSSPACLARTPEKRKNSRRFGVHMGNPS